MPRLSRASSAPAASSLGHEPFVAWLCESRAFRSPWLTLEDGSRLRVVFAGRRWGAPGPDYRGAVLERPDGSLVRGDVEVHPRAGDWRAHGHQCNPEYDGVVLHVVLEARGAAARRKDGSIVPSVALLGQLGDSLEVLRARFALDPRVARREPPRARDEHELAALLDAAGLARFQARAAVLEPDLSWASPEQVLYRELLVALGYATNKDPARRLAEALPYAELAASLWTRGPERRAEAAQALLLGRAGLLPEVELPVPAGILREWALLDDRDPRRLPRSAWRLRLTRPDNHPTRRLAGLGLWVAGRLESGWVESLASLVRQASASPTLRGLADPFCIRAEDDFWPFHFDFGRPTERARPWLVGRGRALEIVVNVLLPGCFAFGQTRGDETLSAAALRCYQRLPATPENRVTSYMAEEIATGLPRRLYRGAARQQGLLHLFHSWCAERRCDHCPAARAGQLGLL